MEKWYAVMAKPRKEQTAVSFLAQVGIETYFPEINECFSLKGETICASLRPFPRIFLREV